MREKGKNFKKRKWVWVILGAAAMGFIAYVGVRWYLAEQSGIAGWFYKVSEDRAYLICEEGKDEISLISLTNYSEDKLLFKGLNTGDYIKIAVSEQKECYPGRAIVIYVRKLKQGSLDDMPQEALDEIDEWLNEVHNK